MAIVSGPRDLFGPTYWADNYGIESFDEFKTACAHFIPHVLPFGNLGTDSTTLLQGYEFPWSAPGLLFQQGLTQEGYTGEAAASGRSLLSLAQDGLVQNEQGAPMGQLIIPDCFQVSIQMITGGKTVENVIGVEQSAGTSSGAAVAVKSAWEVSGGPLEFLSSLVVMQNYHSVDISSGSGAIADEASTAPGGQTGDSLATRGACGLIQWNGATRNRSSRGRMYYGPIRESDVNPDGATLTSTAIGNFDDAFTAFRGQLSAAGYPLVVLSRVLSEAFTVTQHSVETTIATQRRRIRD